MPREQSPLADRQTRSSIAQLFVGVVWRDRAAAFMGMNGNEGALILVVDDMEEVRDAIESLLESDGYRIEAAGSEKCAIECAIRHPPQLIFVNLPGSLEGVIAAAWRVRQRAGLGDGVPIVVFCVEGSEVNLGAGLYCTRPDNFNQLRKVLRRLLHSSGH